MAVAVECRHGMVRDWCGVCREESKEAGPAVTMVARFDGLCRGCGEKIAAEETTIGLVDDTWVCEECL